MTNNVNQEYRVNLEVFEGPLDLLMHLIKKNDLDIYDIPISFILEQYMTYVDSMQELDIDLAGEFLLMAAELAYIKSKMLLPDGALKDDDSEEDPRASLVERLLEYQRFKDAASKLENLNQLGRDVFVPLKSNEPGDDDHDPELMEADVYQLIEAFSQILKRTGQEAFHSVVVDKISVSERVFQIVDLLKQKKLILLDELIGDNYSRSNILVNFLAILEMSKLKMVSLYQTSPGGPIHIQPVMQSVGEEEVKKLIDEGISF